MTRARLISSSLAAALLVAGVAAVAIVRPPWFAGLVDRFGLGSPSLPPRLADPLGRLQPAMRDMLADPAPDAPSPFIRLTRVRPEEFCKSLATSGLKNATFQKGEPPMRGWTCVTDLVKPIDGDDAKVSSLFVVARGIESDRIDNLRMKLNLLDEATSPAVRAIARDTLWQICRSLGFEPPGQVVDALDDLREGRIFDGGVSYDLRREFGPASRLNLIIIFPRTLGAGGEDRFVTDPRRQPVSR